MEKWGCPRLLVGNQLKGFYNPTQALWRHQRCQKWRHGEVMGCPSGCPERWGKAPAEPGVRLGMASPCPHRPALSPPPDKQISTEGRG